ncbi:FAD assembly factor SdhE [Tatumella sp. JGM130]|uniref:FAD assembly factor SdhE n=1 Tax=Tatumella sp. JGM130 TaxID=2799797 RepID=UPI001BB026FB|nr:FAD assembly factor SdhE [Tatumella sp. JGM130]MBS0894970.1 FAD assembly factor SdhE [Tatumella sp. JGM130]
MSDNTSPGIEDKSRIQWACRRGMLELDMAIMPFFKYEYDSLSDQDKQCFIHLLGADDPDLFNWMMQHGEPADPQLKRMVNLIRERNALRGPVAR